MAKWLQIYPVRIYTKVQYNLVYSSICVIFLSFCIKKYVQKHDNLALDNLSHSGKYQTKTCSSYWEAGCCLYRHINTWPFNFIIFPKLKCCVHVPFYRCGEWVSECLINSIIKTYVMSGYLFRMLIMIIWSSFILIFRFYFFFRFVCVCLHQSKWSPQRTRS